MPILYASARFVKWDDGSMGERGAENAEREEAMFCVK